MEWKIAEGIILAVLLIAGAIGVLMFIGWIVEGFFEMIVSIPKSLHDCWIEFLGICHAIGRVAGKIHRRFA